LLVVVSHLIDPGATRKQIRERSLRVAVVFVGIIVIFFAAAFVFLFVFFLVWLLSKEDIGSYRPIRRV
jgi:hypothetical protein